MKVCIIGWYGTETIGDRAILAGILSLINEVNQDFEVLLGSLYPFFTERTLEEDSSFYKQVLGRDVKIRLFNSKYIRELDQAIKACDVLMMGGGPLMHINALFMIEYAFRQAKRAGKKSIVFGCGVGPLFKKQYKKSVVNIIRNSDEVVLRDINSKGYFKKILNELNKKYDLNNIHVSLDPSVKSMLNFLDFETPMISERVKRIAINLREFPAEYSQKSNSSLINNRLIGVIRKLAETYKDYKISLIPMSYFHVGNDDREFLNEIKFEVGATNLEGQNKPLSLFQTMQVFQNAGTNIGMRFHSVVFQTLLNGNNYILDYTEPLIGKVSGFLQDVGGKDFYNDRYVNLHVDENRPFNIFCENLNNRFKVDQNLINDKLSIYFSCLKKIL